jgi:hypothetical protein
VRIVPTITLADGRWVEVPASGHGVPSDNRAGFLAVVRPFLLVPASQHG